ncbi:hypothetical protein ACGFJT_37340 [Actinomadura geliboluensis]|uniref:hypothetical protein n=1 Tax=Actinomadura geliboluensis TaxID=882440 RepID=UPI00371C8238
MSKSDTGTTTEVPDPRLSELTDRAAAIKLPTTPDEIDAALGRIRRDIRAGAAADSTEDMHRELGNLMVSALRWMRVYGLEPRHCIAAAVEAQRAYTERLTPTPVPEGETR